MKKLQFGVLGLTIGFALACGGFDVDTGSLYIPPPPPPAGSAVCPPGAITTPVIQKGQSVTLMALHPDDAYFGGDTQAKIPLRGKPTSDEGLTVQDGCWYSGEFEAPGGDSFYFYKAAFTR